MHFIDIIFLYPLYTYYVRILCIFIVFLCPVILIIHLYVRMCV